MYVIYICNWEVRLRLQDKWINSYNWSYMNIGAVGCIHLVRTLNRGCLASQKLRWSVSLCCIENKDFNLTASNWPSKIRQTSLLTAHPAFFLELGRSSPLQVRMCTGLIEELPPCASVDPLHQKNTDIQLFVNLKLKGGQVGFTENTRNETDDWDVESSLS
jgi:hypothetical protein